MQIDTHWTPAVVQAAQDLSPSVRGLWLRPTGGMHAWTVGSHLRVQVPTGPITPIGPTGPTRPITPDAPMTALAAVTSAAPAAAPSAPSAQDAAQGNAFDIRHYSLVGLPAHSQAAGCYPIAVKRTAASRGGSRFMAALQPGDTVQIAGPDNQFALPVAAPFTLLVAGGIGITPLLGMALTLAARGAPLRMLYAARDDAELVFADTLRQALGQRLQTFSSACGERIALADEIAALPPRAQLLICGPAPLLQAAQEAWARAGRPLADLRFETFGSSGSRPAEAFWVDIPRHQLRLQVPADRSLLDVLAQHGIDLLFDCRRGECGLCAVDVLRVQGDIDHRDVFFSAEQKRSGSQLCACVSRVCGGGLVIDSAWRADGATVAAA